MQTILLATNLFYMWCDHNEHILTNVSWGYIIQEHVASTQCQMSYSITRSHAGTWGISSSQAWIILYYSDPFLLYSSLSQLSYMDYTQEPQSRNLWWQPNTSQPLILDTTSWWQSTSYTYFKESVLLSKTALRDDLWHSRIFLSYIWASPSKDHLMEKQRPTQAQESVSRRSIVS